MSQTNSKSYTFPNGFMFGASTAAYQIEGGWNEDGKGEHIWDRLVHTHPELISDRTNGDIACDSYHKYKEDITLAKNLNLKSYRFSISWARILPSGEINSLNQKGIEYYNCVIDELIANNITPIVTMYHWDLPQNLQDLGGWVNPIMSNYFEKYAEVLFTHYADRVKYWITINEPLQTSQGYAYKKFAPYLSLKSTGYYLAAHTQLIAHGKAYRLYEELFKSKYHGKISISISSTFYMPKNKNSENDINTAERANQFETGWISHPVYKGDYPPIMREWIDKKCKEEGRPWSTLPIFTDDEIKMIKGTADFYAINHYTSRLVTDGIDSDKNFNQDARYVKSVDKSWPKSSTSEWIYVVPEGFNKLLLWIKNEYGNPPIIITANGYSDNGKINDLGRINYIQAHLSAILEAIYEDNCNVISYTVWSLLDNFAWFNGYVHHFGLVNVDFNDPERRRTPKNSYMYLKGVIASNQLPDIYQCA